MARSLVACVAVALVLMACSAPMASPEASSRPSPTASPASQPPSTSSPSPSPSSPLALGPDLVAEVVTTDLVMRSAPGIFDDSLIYPGTLGPGDRLYIVDGPVSADGYDWYLGDPYLVRQEGDLWVRFGWVAAADKTGEEWLIPVEPDCPSDARIPALHDLPMPLRLACFGDRSVQLEGDVTCPDLGPPIPTPSPPWMTWDSCYLNPHGAPFDPFDGTTALGLPIHYPPDAERQSGFLRITGHFDDPRATECRFHVPVPEDDLYQQDLEHRAQQLRCRSSLVVDEAVPAGDG